MCGRPAADGLWVFVAELRERKGLEPGQGSPRVGVNAHDAEGLTFECKPGCGFCCTASPLVGPHERARLSMAVRTPDGDLRIPIAGVACSALAADRRCSIYDARPAVCHLYPYAVHAGRRIQVTVSLACPGVAPAHPTGHRDTEGDRAHPFGVANKMEEGAQRAADLALAQPGARDEAARAKATFAEFDRRMKEWKVSAPPDKLRAAFLPHVGTLAHPASLPSFFAAIAEGDLMLGGEAARSVGALFAVEADAELADLYDEGARDAFDEPDTVAWVEPDLSWTTARVEGGRVQLTRIAEGATRTRGIATDELPAGWEPEATDVVAAYLARLLQRDHAEGAAAWLVDASGYQATPAAAYARVLGEASLHVALRASLFAAEDERDVVEASHARRGVCAYETAFHSLPTLGAIL